MQPPTGQALYDLKVGFTIEGFNKDIAAGRFAHVERGFLEYLFYVPQLRQIGDELQSRGVPVTGLDVGCGRGVAAQHIQDLYDNMSMHGIDIVKYPVNPNKSHLPDDKIIIDSLGHANLPNESYDLILAIGSLDVSHTLEEDGPRILELLKPNGYAIIAPTSIRNDTAMESTLNMAKLKNMTVSEVINRDNLPCYVIRRGS